MEPSNDIPVKHLIVNKDYRCLLCNNKYQRERDIINHLEKGVICRNAYATRTAQHRAPIASVEIAVAAAAPADDNSDSSSAYDGIYNPDDIVDFLRK